MARMSVSEFRDELAETLNRVMNRGTRIVLHRRGRAVAALVSIEDLELLEELEDRIDLDQACAALREAGKNGTVSWNKVKTDLDG